MTGETLLAIVITALCTGAANWAAFRVELRWLRADIKRSDEAASAMERRLHRVELIIARVMARDEEHAPDS